MEEIKAVEMVREIRDAHYERLKDSTPQEKITFFREQARALQEELGLLKWVAPQRPAPQRPHLK